MVAPILIAVGVAWGSPEYWSDALSRVNRIHVPLSGVAEYEDFQGVLRLEPGTAYLMTNGYAKNFHLLPGSDYLHLYFDFNCTPPLLNRPALQIRKEEDTVLFSLFSAAISLIETIKPLDGKSRIVEKNLPLFRELEGLCKTICSYLFRTYDIPTIQDPKVAQALDYIREHYSEPIGNTEIASALHIDNRYLIRLFRRYLSVTPYQYLTQYRIERGRELLRRGVSVSETAYACGYQSETAFRLAFKRIIGFPPSFPNYPLK